MPDPLGEIDEPWHLECRAPAANLAPLPSDTMVIPTGTGAPAWPSNPLQGFTLNCADFAGCEEEFSAPILEFLGYDDTNALWGADMGRADYLATTSGTSTTSITITISNPSAPSSDTHDADGRVEYSAPDCGYTDCPFYLTNLSLSNNTDTWQVYSYDLGENIYVSDISVQLRRPTLGVWNTSTNEVYLGNKRVDMYVSGTVQVGTDTPVEGTFLVTNLDAIFGSIGTYGELQVTDLVATDGDSLTFESDLDFDTLSGSPPVANSGLGTTVSAPSGSGLPISTLIDSSSDPDSDIENKIWFVDGIERETSYVIPTGAHQIDLWVTDERGALDIDKSQVTVQYP